MKCFDWNQKKNELLKLERGVCFEDVVIILNKKAYLDLVKHPNQERYPDQNMFIVKIENYIYLVPFIEDEGKIFLKTIIPSRKATRKYLMGGSKK